MIPEPHTSEISKEMYKDMDYYHLSKGGYLCRFFFEGGQLCLDFKYRIVPKGFDIPITVMSVFRFDENELQSLITFIDEHTKEAS